ncbi:MAG: VgrG protein [uncultured Thermomicrobiales bacterium]|uniref:VgrG protein n=1 Tax=uncultured Thermomicrobiales bacterium TaxID=1645740 RepID=A0A6J4VFC6_9BACT|nr:MAG: VgrG protein [uncultured Thermomicrobiales bacterium]
MLRACKLFLAVGMLALLAACGGAAPTATPPPTNTPVPPTATVAPTNTPVPPTATVAPTNTPVPPTPTVAPTNTPVPPTATIAPTRAATAAATGAQVTDSSGKCRMTLNPVFRANAGSTDTYSTADSLAILTFAGTDTPGLALDAATTAFIGGFQSVVTGYVETGRQTSKDARGDIQIVTFNGAVSGQQAKGVFYFVQNGSVLCSLVALAIPPGDQQYADAAQQTAGTLVVVQGGAGSSAAPVAPVAPTRAPAATVAPTVAPTRAAAPPSTAGGTTVTDTSGACRMTLPANFKAGSDGDNYETADDLALVTIGGSNIGGLAFADAVNLYVTTFQGAINGFVETGRQSVAVPGGQKETITYSGTLVGQPVKGVLYFYQVNDTLCSLSGVALPPGDTRYQADLQVMVDTLGPVGR